VRARVLSQSTKQSQGGSGGASNHNLTAEETTTSLADMSGSDIDKSGITNNMAGSTSSDCSAVRANRYLFGNTPGATGNHSYNLPWNDF
jgi:hypothetical protein